MTGPGFATQSIDTLSWPLTSDLQWKPQPWPTLGPLASLSVPVHFSPVHAPPSAHTVPRATALMCCSSFVIQTFPQFRGPGPEGWHSACSCTSRVVQRMQMRQAGVQDADKAQA